MSPEAATTATSRSSAANSACASSPFRLFGVRTGRPCSSAQICTGLFCSFLPRCAGRGGWLVTGAVVCPPRGGPAGVGPGKGGVSRKAVPLGCGFGGGQGGGEVCPSPLGGGAETLQPHSAGP